MKSSRAACFGSERAGVNGFLHRECLCVATGMGDQDDPSHHSGHSGHSSMSTLPHG